MPMNNRLMRPRQTLHPEALDWRNRVVANGGSVSGTTLNAVDRFVKAIVAAGIRDRFYRLNLFCGNSDASLAAVRTPLFRGQSLTGTQFGNTIDTNNNFVAGDYAETGASGGLTGNGTSKYLNTGLGANVIPDLSQSGHLSVYAAGTFAGEIAISTYTFTSPPFAATHISEIQLSTSSSNSFINQHGASAPTHSSPVFVVGSRTSTTNLVCYANGVGGAAQTSPAMLSNPSQPFFVFARNLNAVPAGYAGFRLRSYSIGLGMSASQVSAFNAAIQAFQSALARGV